MHNPKIKWDSHVTFKHYFNLQNTPLGGKLDRYGQRTSHSAHFISWLALNFKLSKNDTDISSQMGIIQLFRSWIAQFIDVIFQDYKTCSQNPVKSTEQNKTHWKLHNHSMIIFLKRFFKFHMRRFYVVSGADGNEKANLLYHLLIASCSHQITSLDQWSRKLLNAN